MEIPQYYNTNNYDLDNKNYIKNCKKYVNNINNDIEKFKFILCNNCITYYIKLKIHRQLNYMILCSNIITDNLYNIENNNISNDLCIDEIEHNIYEIEESIHNIVLYQDKYIEESTIIECNTDILICHLNNKKIDYIENDKEISFTKSLIPQEIKYGDYTDYITIVEDNDLFKYISFVFEVINKNIIKIKVFYVNDNIEEVYNMKDIDDSNYVKYNITLKDLNYMINDIM